LLTLPNRKAAPERILPTRPFGTCSAVPIELVAATDGDPNAPFMLWYNIDDDFVRELQAANECSGRSAKEEIGKAAVGQRLRAALLVEGGAPKANFAEQHATLDIVRASLARHCALPMCEAADKSSYWPFLRLVRVTGPFPDMLVPPGVVLTDAPGDSDGNPAQQAACYEAMHNASVVLQIFDCNQFLQPATARTLLRTLTLVCTDDLCVVVTKFLDDDKDGLLARSVLEQNFSTRTSLPSGTSLPRFFFKGKWIIRRKFSILHSNRGQRALCAQGSFGSKRKGRSQQSKNINTSFRVWALKVSRSTLMPKSALPDKVLGACENFDPPLGRRGTSGLRTRVFW
jgi:hypothetical protein